MTEAARRRAVAGAVDRVEDQVFAPREPLLLRGVERVKLEFASASSCPHSASASVRGEIFAYRGSWLLSWTGSASMRTRKSVKGLRRSLAPG